MKMRVPQARRFDIRSLISLREFINLQEILDSSEVLDLISDLELLEAEVSRMKLLTQGEEPPGYYSEFEEIPVPLAIEKLIQELR